MLTVVSAVSVSFCVFFLVLTMRWFSISSNGVYKTRDDEKTQFCSVALKLLQQSFVLCFYSWSMKILQFFFLTRLIWFAAFGQVHRRTWLRKCCKALSRRLPAICGRWDAYSTRCLQVQMHVLLILVIDCSVNNLQCTSRWPYYIIAFTYFCYCVIAGWMKFCCFPFRCLYASNYDLC